MTSAWTGDYQRMQWKEIIYDGIDLFMELQFFSEEQYLFYYWTAPWVAIVPIGMQRLPSWKAYSQKLRRGL